MLKTHSCGDLRKEHAGQEVTVAGWVHRRRDHGGLIFFDLRDSRGLVQVVFHPEDASEAHKVARDVRPEFVIAVTGEVSARKVGTENPDLPTGEIEVVASSVEVMNEAKTPPFPINEDTEVEELVRLKYRYLDLRRERMQRNLRIRDKTTAFIRNFLRERDFMEVETPILTNSTPEGARDYLIPARLNPGRFYALPQSPQQYKQILMVAGVERYFQIARCARDEDLRADRQPDFTQLDVEMAFATEEDVLTLFEALFTGLVDEVRPDLKYVSPFPRITYEESMQRFGTDKPDLRFGLELYNIDDLAGASEFGVFRSAIETGGTVEGICAPNGTEFARKEIDSLTTFVQGLGAKGLVSIGLLGEPGSLTDDDIRSPVAKYLSLELVEGAAQRANANKGDLLLLVAGEGGKGKTEPGSSNRVKPALDGLRREIASRLELADKDMLHFAFITEFPLVEWDEDAERWDALHHLFTAPMVEDMKYFESDPAKIRSRAYDTVCNGTELGSGSVRIHQRGIQERVLGLLGVSDEQAALRFGHMGFAPGIDRTVAMLAQEEDIREIIAFPKTKNGSEPMTGAPSVVDQEQLDVLGIKLVEQPEA
jgi:aspartyl-tRNA synthetase